MLSLAPLRSAALILSAGLLLPQVPGVSAPADAQAAQDPRRIQARDGDIILIERGDTVRIVRRQHGEIRVVYDAAQDWLLILADYASRPGAGPDGGVDQTYSFTGLTGGWPLGERWQGQATVDDYSQAGQVGLQGLGIETPAGFIQILPSFQQSPFSDPRAMMLLYRGAGTGGGGGQAFDIVEEQQVAVARRNAEMRAKLAGGGPVTSSGLEFSVSGAVAPAPARPGGAPLRVGGSIAPPRKIVHVDPEWPALARQVGMQGVVLLEATIDAEGRVSEAKVLRSIQMLDEAALAAVRQWRYEPATLNGKPVPVVMTVAVPFTPQSP
jgi:TonB family protein